MTNSSRTPPGRLDEFEATHSLKQIKAMARERGVSTHGTKREIAARLSTIPSRGRVAQTVPQTMPGGEEYAWQNLERQPYGLAIWDIPLVEGELTVVFMAREPRAQLLKLPQRTNANWKALSVGTEIRGRRVLPVIVMIHFIPLATIYEVWFNFYGETGWYVQEAFTLLGQQPNNYLFFHDRGPEPVRKIGFPNTMDSFFRGHYGMIKAMPEWSDEDFNEAKRQLMEEYTGDQLWRMK